MMISLDTEKVFDKIHSSLKDKNIQQTNNWWKLSQPDEGQALQNPQLTLYLMVKD